MALYTTKVWKKLNFTESHVSNKAHKNEKVVACTVRLNHRTLQVLRVTSLHDISYVLNASVHPRWTFQISHLKHGSVQTVEHLNEITMSFESFVTLFHLWNLVNTCWQNLEFSRTRFCKDYFSTFFKKEYKNILQTSHNKATMILHQTASFFIKIRIRLYFCWFLTDVFFF